MLGPLTIAPLTILSISIFGVVGILSRYLVGLYFSSTTTAHPLPIATFIINIVGSLLIGIIFVLSTEKGLLPIELRLGIIVGLLGGFTTFSTFSLDALLLIETGRYLQAAAYFVLSPTVGLASAFLGAKICRLVF